MALLEEGVVEVKNFLLLAVDKLLLLLLFDLLVLALQTNLMLDLRYQISLLVVHHLVLGLKSSKGNLCAVRRCCLLV